jgi:hypothetical protein
VVGRGQAKINLQIAFSTGNTRYRWKEGFQCKGEAPVVCDSAWADLGIIMTTLVKLQKGCRYCFEFRNWGKPISFKVKFVSKADERRENSGSYHLNCGTGQSHHIMIFPVASSTFQKRLLRIAICLYFARGTGIEILGSVLSMQEISRRFHFCKEDFRRSATME